MKVGTDAVLLGAWSDVDNAPYILDIGSGSGILALMVAQRTPHTTQIDGVEIEKLDWEQSLENISASPWSSRIAIHQMAIQDFSPAIAYDVVITNPPYFNNSQEPPDARRHQTRHTITLEHEELILHALRLLKPEGRFNVVLPYTEGLLFIDLALKHELCCSRQYSFRTRIEKPIERWLLEFRRSHQSIETGELLLYDEGLEWSSGYKKLTKDFYLKL